MPGHELERGQGQLPILMMLEVIHQKRQLRLKRLLGDRLSILRNIGLAADGEIRLAGFKWLLRLSSMSRSAGFVLLQLHDMPFNFE